MSIKHTEDVKQGTVAIAMTGALSRRSLASDLRLALTFNLGRDLTLLVIWPIIFAYVGAKIFERSQVQRMKRSRRAFGHPSGYVGRLR